MKHYFPYAPYAPQEVLGEVHKIKDGQIMLDHIPFENSIEIDGFKQTDNVNLLPNQFFCSYGANEYYRESNCIVYFNPEHDGQLVSVDYLQVGTIIIADDLNEIKEHLENDAIHGDIKYELPPATWSLRGGVRVGYGLDIVGDILNVAATLVGGIVGSVSGGLASLPVANETLLGGIMVGDGLTMVGEHLNLALGTTPLTLEGSMWLIV